MKHIIASNIKNRRDAETEASLVHYDGPGIVGWHTLCGHVDQVEYKWAETTKRVNCPGCLGVRRHVTNGR